MSRHSVTHGAMALSAAVLLAISSPAAAAGLGTRAAPGQDALVRVQDYYPPPGYYPPAAPPPVYQSPPAYQAPPRDLNRAYDPTIDGPLGYPTQRGAAPRPAVPYSAMCYAGAYVCQLPVAGPVGSGCSCPGLGAPSYGSIR